jgi:hypothetical protein
MTVLPQQRPPGWKPDDTAARDGRRYGAQCPIAPGYPERFAQQALGHNSKAVHHA